MVRVRDILKEIEQYAPLPLQEDFDNAGVQVGDINQPATGVLFCVDVTEEVIDEAPNWIVILLFRTIRWPLSPFKSLTVLPILNDV